MVAWLRTLGSTSMAAPSQAQIDAEIALLAPPEPEIPEAAEGAASDVMDALKEQAEDAAAGN